MNDFVAIDFETANPRRVSACSLGYAVVENARIVDSGCHLIKPVGGHAPFQSKIHGITDEHTRDKPLFRDVFPSVQHLFESLLVAHSLFDKQVLLALFEHSGIAVQFQYFDTSAMAKQHLPNLRNHKLKTLVRHFELPTFKHHDAREDAIACAKICLKLNESAPSPLSERKTSECDEFLTMATSILSDNAVTYKEAYQLLYWLHDHERMAEKHFALYERAREALDDDNLDKIEAEDLRVLVEQAVRADGFPKEGR